MLAHPNTGQAFGSPVDPGTGWPGDPATPQTPMAANAAQVVAPVRCAPPANAPTPAERDTCWPWLAAEWRLVSEHVRAIVALGGFGWQIALRLPGVSGVRKPRFGHGVVAELGSGVRLLGCYHPSQQNMFTGRLTPVMLDDIFSNAKRLAGIK